MTDALLVALAVIVGVWLAVIIVLYATGRTVLAREAARLIPNLAMLFAALMRDPRVPRRAKVALVCGAVWLASPIDLVPEFLPVIGPLDDAIVAALVLGFVVRTAGREVVLHHWKGDPQVIARLLSLTRA